MTWFLIVMMQKMKSFWNGFSSATSDQNVKIKVSFNVSQVTPGVSTFQKCAPSHSTNSKISRLVGMVLTWRTARIFNAMWCLNAPVFTVFLGRMFVMECGTVQKEWMKQLEFAAQWKFVKRCSNVMHQLLFAFQLEQCVMEQQIVQKEKTKSCVFCLTLFALIIVSAWL